MARDLKAGDRLRMIGGIVSIHSIEPGATQKVYNLTVAENRDFLVGNAGLLVHDYSFVHAGFRAVRPPDQPVPAARQVNSRRRAAAGEIRYTENPAPDIIGRMRIVERRCNNRRVMRRSRFGYVRTAALLVACVVQARRLRAEHSAVRQRRRADLARPLHQVPRGRSAEGRARPPHGRLHDPRAATPARRSSPARAARA